MNIKELPYLEGKDSLDWVEVIDVCANLSYDWDEFHAWYSPKDRTYYWGADSGCSCSYYGYYIKSTSQFQSSQDKEVLARSLSEYLKDNHYSHDDRARYKAALREFKPITNGEGMTVVVEESDARKQIE